MAVYVTSGLGSSRRSADNGDSDGLGTMKRGCSIPTDCWSGTGRAQSSHSGVTRYVSTETFASAATFAPLVVTVSV